MTALRQWFEARSKYWGVIGALVLFASWGVDSFIGARANQAENRIAVVNNSKDLVDWQGSVDLKLNNLEKTILRNRDVGPIDESQLSTAQRRLFRWSKELESVSAFRSDWDDLEKHASSL